MEGGYKFIHAFSNFLRSLNTLLIQISQMLLDIPPQPRQLSNNPRLLNIRLLLIKSRHLRRFIPHTLPNNTNPIIRKFRSLERDFQFPRKFSKFLGLRFIHRLDLFKVFEEIADDVTPCYRLARDMRGRTFKAGVEWIAGVSDV